MTVPAEAAMVFLWDPDIISHSEPQGEVDISLGVMEIPMSRTDGRPMKKHVNPVPRRGHHLLGPSPTPTHQATTPIIHH